MQQPDRQCVGTVASRLLQQRVPLDDQFGVGSTKKPRHAFQHVDLGTLHINLYEVCLSVHEIVQPSNRHGQNACDGGIAALWEQAVHRTSVAAHKKVARTNSAARGNRLNDDIRKAGCSYVLLQNR